TRDCARHCSIESPIALTSWKRERNRIASAELPRNRRRDRRRTNRSQAVEMPVRGKPGKPNAGFPLLPPPLEIAAAIPTFPPLRRLLLYKRKGRNSLVAESMT